MGSSSEYWCDLCDAKFGDGFNSDWRNLFTLKRVDDKTFELTQNHDDDLRHICRKCINRIVELAPTLGIV